MASFTLEYLKKHGSLKHFFDSAYPKTCLSITQNWFEIGSDGFEWVIGTPTSIQQCATMAISQFPNRQLWGVNYIECAEYPTCSAEFGDHRSSAIEAPGNDFCRLLR